MALKAGILMVVVQVLLAGMDVLYKLAAYNGMSPRVTVAYRFIFATFFMAPIAFYLERERRPQLTWTVLFQAFFCGLFGGSLSQNLFLEGLVLTSTTFVTAICNIIPAITFILVICFRLEKLGLRKLTGKAKVLGTVLGIAGAMLLTFYKGVEIKIWSSPVNLLKSAAGHKASRNQLLGCLMAIGNCFSYSTWLIIQTNMSERYPCPYSITALMSFMGSIQSTIFALCMEDRSQWKLGWNIRLLTAVYGGIVASGLVGAMMSWCIHKKGPLFVSAFNPLLLLIVAIVASLLLDEKIYLGGILGAVLIICGLYAVLWGKSKEKKDQESVTNIIHIV